MSPLKDSEDEDMMFAPNDDDDDDEYVIDPQNVIVLDENDAPEIDQEVEDLDIEDFPEEVENGYVQDDSKSVFNHHEGSVFCVNISPKDQNIVVSGGEDDRGVVVNLSNGNTLFECVNHKDSITDCGFSSDGKYVMTADMSGVIIVRNVEDGQTVWDFECDDIFWCKWHQTATVLFAGTVKGDIYMWKIPSGELKIYPSHGSGCRDGCLLLSGKELLSVYEDGTVKLWDLKKMSPLFTDKIGDDPILTATCQRPGNLLACGTENGSVHLLNTSGKRLTTFNVTLSPNTEEDSCSVESVCFSLEGQLLGAASLNGSVYIWDLTTQRLRNECKHSDGVSHLTWLENESNIILSASTDGVISKWDTRNGQLVKEYRGHRGSLLGLCVSIDGKTLVTSGDDGTVRVFDNSF